MVQVYGDKLKSIKSREGPSISVTQETLFSLTIMEDSTHSMFKKLLPYCIILQKYILLQYKSYSH